MTIIIPILWRHTPVFWSTMSSGWSWSIWRAAPSPTLLHIRAWMRSKSPLSASSASRLWPICTHRCVTSSDNETSPTMPNPQPKPPPPFSFFLSSILCLSICFGPLSFAAFFVVWFRFPNSRCARRVMR